MCMYVCARSRALACVSFSFFPCIPVAQIHKDLRHSGVIQNRKSTQSRCQVSSLALHFLQLWVPPLLGPQPLTPSPTFAPSTPSFLIVFTLHPKPSLQLRRYSPPLFVPQHPTGGTPSPVRSCSVAAPATWSRIRPLCPLSYSARFPAGGSRISMPLLPPRRPLRESRRRSRRALLI